METRPFIQRQIFASIIVSLYPEALFSCSDANVLTFSLNTTSYGQHEVATAYRIWGLKYHVQVETSSRVALRISKRKLGQLNAQQ
jgi:hypothetical protein